MGKIKYSVGSKIGPYTILHRQGNDVRIECECGTIRNAKMNHMLDKKVKLLCKTCGKSIVREDENGRKNNKHKLYLIFDSVKDETWTENQQGICSFFGCNLEEIIWCIEKNVPLRDRFYIDYLFE